MRAGASAATRAKGPVRATTKGQRGQQLSLLTFGQGSGGGLVLDPLGGEVRGNGAAGMAGSRQAPRAAFGEGGIIHRARGDQAFGDTGDFAVQGGGAGSDGFP